MKNRSARQLKFHKFQMLLMVGIMLFTTACNISSSNRGGQEEPPQGTEELSDPEAELYRMYSDTSGDMTENELQIREFVGNIQIADIEDIFGNLDDLPKDDNGNIFAVAENENGIWYLNMAAGGYPVNLASRLVDGTQSSIFDLDGDGTADIIDIRLPDDRRISIVTELMGLGAFEDFLNGPDSFCQTDLARQLGFPDLGCGNSSGGGGGGDGGGQGYGGGIVDPIDLLCAGYATGTRAGLMNAVRPRTDAIYNQSITAQRYSDGSSRIIADKTYTRDGTLYHDKLIMDFDADGNLVQTVEETLNVDEGIGSRRTTLDLPARTNPDGSVTLPTNSSNTVAFSAQPDDNGNYNSNTADPPTSNHPTAPGSPTTTGVNHIIRNGEPVSRPESGGGTQGDPGPEGDDSSIADFCARRGNQRSGAEQAAGTNPGAFNVSCNDLVGAPANGDCIIIEWAGAADFSHILDAPSDDSCGEFREPGEGGECEPTTSIERLRGLTARIASLNLPGVVLCPPIVCNPAFSPSAGRQEISGSSEEQPEVVTETPEGSNHGNIGNDTFCYWGPGSGYPTVNALQYGTEVQIIGIGAVQSWLVIDSPAYPGVPCWVAGEDVFPDPGFDPSAFPVIPIPVVELELPDGNGQSGEEHVEGPEDCDPETEYWSEKAQACETLY